MRAGVWVAIGGVAAILVATNPASAFNSGSDPESYYDGTISAVDDHRGWQGTQGVAYSPAEDFTRRLPDDEFDDLMLRMINKFRTDNGRPELQQYENLRVESAIWSNHLADIGTTNEIDDWAQSDAQVVCNPVADLYTTSAVSSGRPEDVFNQWVQNPGIRNAILEPTSAWVGIGTVDDGSQEWTTMRIVEGNCPGGVLPYRAQVTGLPKPEIHVWRTGGGSELAIRVDRNGDAQLTIQIQQAAGFHWVAWQSSYIVPRTQTLVVQTPPGRYRVVVPAQSGYDTAFTGLLEVG